MRAPTPDTPATSTVPKTLAPRVRVHNLGGPLLSFLQPQVPNFGDPRPRPASSGPRSRTLQTSSSALLPIAELWGPPPPSLQSPAWNFGDPRLRAAPAPQNFGDPFAVLQCGVSDFGDLPRHAISSPTRELRDSRAPHPRPRAWNLGSPNRAPLTALRLRTRAPLARPPPLSAPPPVPSRPGRRRPASGLREPRCAPCRPGPRGREGEGGAGRRLRGRGRPGKGAGWGRGEEWRGKGRGGMGRLG
jgi:hypothetical protein